jgi:CheY-like chemotaxis protein
MEAIGRLAGGVAHDFNNLLTAIIGYGELALSGLPEDSDARGEIEEILKAGHSAAGLTQQLLAFSRRQVLEPRVVNLNDVIARMQAMLARLIGEDISLRTDLAPDLRPIYGDPSQLEQILMNLAVNARDAMPEGGTVTVRSANVDVRAEAVADLGLSAGGPHVQLTVTDTGTGMTDEVRARLFEPFFTTKEGGKGTGLGLATVYKIVTQSGGAIDVDSEIGRGTTFRILLPVRGAGLARTDDEVDRPAAETLGHETILVVEDQAEVRAVARHILQRSGYRVIEADGPEEAIAIARDHNLAIDLLLTDIVMPVMSGPALAARLHAQRPALNVVYTSGYSEDHVALLQEISAAGVPFVQKPFTPGALRATIREALDRRRAVSRAGDDHGSRR